MMKVEIEEKDAEIEKRVKVEEELRGEVER